MGLVRIGRLGWRFSTWPAETVLTCRMAQRVTLRKRTPYNTTSNRRRVVKTPGGKLVVHHIKKLTVGLARISLRVKLTDRRPPSAVTAATPLPVSPSSAPASVSGAHSGVRMLSGEGSFEVGGKEGPPNGDQSSEETDTTRHTAVDRPR